MRETPEQRATRIGLGTSKRRRRTLDQGRRFTTTSRAITTAAVAFVEGTGSRRGDTAPAGLVLGYALGLVPLVDERIVAVRPGGSVALEREAHVGDAIHVEGSIARVDALDDDNDIVRMTCRVVNQRQEQIGHIEVDALLDHGPRPNAACREQDYVKKESAAAVPA